MKPCIVFCDFVNSNIDLTTRFAIYKKCGIESISPPWGEQFYSDDFTRFDIYNEAKKHDINVDVVHLDYEENNWLWQERIEGDKLLAKILGQLLECAERKVKIAIMHLTRTSEECSVTNTGLNRIRKVAEYCAQHGIRLAVENLRDVSHVEYVLANIKNNSLGMLFDIGHANCYSHDVFGLFKKFKDRIICTHLHNNDGETDNHNSLDDGNIDFEKFFSMLETTENHIQYHLIEATPHVENAHEFEEFVNKNFMLLSKYIG